MRRILEYYFNFLGGIDYKNLSIKDFSKEEISIYRSLTSWINAGSHLFDDDIYSENIENSDVSKYFIVFEKIFKKSGHGAHYDMMMKENELVNL